MNISSELKTVVVVAGPTASGKSAAALSIATAFDGVVINADSMQIYREMSVLTARPSEADMSRATHRLYGMRSVAEPCSAAEWRALAIREIEQAYAADKLPIICGGTGLYISALMDGLSPIPDVPDVVRQEVRDRCARDGMAAMRLALEGVDPDLAAVLKPADRQRTLRALEVFEATGRPLSAWQAEPKSGPPPGYEFVTMVFLPPRDVLYAACNERLAHMVKAGALDEVAALRDANFNPDLPAMKALGVPDFLSHLAGNLALEDALERAQTATRRYAKRQYTWFRNHLIANNVINSQYNYENDSEIFPFIRQKLLTGPN